MKKLYRVKIRKLAQIHTTCDAITIILRTLIVRSVNEAQIRRVFISCGNSDVSLQNKSGVS